MQAWEIMNREIITVPLGTTLAEAAKRMLSHRINALPVVDGDGQIRGMIGIRDVLRVPWAHRSGQPISRWDRMDEKARQLAETRVEWVMSWQVVSVEPEADVIDVAALMANRGIHPIPVLEDGILLGIIGRADVVRAMLKLAKNEEPGSTASGSAAAGA